MKKPEKPAFSKHPLCFWSIVLLLGWAFDFLFWGQLLGLNFLIFIALSLAGGLSLLVTDHHKPAPQSLWLLLPMAFFAMMTQVRQEPLTHFLSVLFTLFALGLLATSYLGGRWMQYSLADYLAKFGRLLANTLNLPLNFVRQTLQEIGEQRAAWKRIPILPVLRGLLLALPVIACFTSLLASADLIFAKRLQGFLALFDLGKASEYSFRLALILFLAYAIAGVFLHAARYSRDKKLLGENEPLVSPFLDFTESAVVLGSVALLFLFFVIVQFRYFFGGEVYLDITGLTYSQYARRGFNELVTVACISLVLVLGLSTLARRNNHIQQRVFSGLNIAIATLVMVMLASAYQRLAMATAWHGFSRLRVYPQIFMVWVGILFLAVVVLEALHRQRNFALAAVLASLGFGISLNLFNVDAAIVHHNVLRASQGLHFNAPYLGSLSNDAVPALAQEFADPALSPAVHEGIGAALLCWSVSRPPHSADLAEDQGAADSGAEWRSFNLSRWQAGQALEALQPDLAAYRVNLKKSPIRVRTPGNVLYECGDGSGEPQED